MKRLQDVRPHFCDERVPARLPPDEAAIAALQRAVPDDALLRERERWRPLLLRILALSNELHPATRYGLKAEAKRLWHSLELGPIPTIEKSARAILRERIALHNRRRRGRHRPLTVRLWPE